MILTPGVNLSSHLVFISTAIPEFISQVNIALEALGKNAMHQFDDSQFVDASKRVYDSIHDIRCAVMMIRVSGL